MREEETDDELDYTTNHAHNSAPTLQGVACQVAREEEKYVDEKQYMMYEILACTFLLCKSCADIGGWFRAHDAPNVFDGSTRQKHKI